MELSQAREEIKTSNNSAFIPVRLQGKCNFRALFEQGTQSPEPNQQILRTNLEIEICNQSQGDQMITKDKKLYLTELKTK